jgi:hypothetical protein
VKKQLLQTPKLPVSFPERPTIAPRVVRSPNTLPADGTELLHRLNDFDARLAGQNRCTAGDVVREIISAGVQAGYSEEITSWTGPAIAFAVETAKAIDIRLRTQTNRMTEPSVA